MNQEQGAPRAEGASGPGKDSGSDTRPEADPRASDPAADPSADLERELDDLRSKAQTYLDLAQRTQADFVNYRRRIEQERGDFARATRADVIAKFLSPIDDLELALRSFPPEVRSSTWAQGIEIVDRKFVQLLESLGVKRVEAVGKKFDPHEDEAIGHEPSSQYPEGVVSSVVRSGYTIDGRVLRPALVVVSSGPAEDAR